MCLAQVASDRPSSEIAPGNSVAYVVRVRAQIEMIRPETRRRVTAVQDVQAAFRVEAEQEVGGEPVD